MPDLVGALAGARTRALSVLIDAGRITLDPDRNDDATIDPVTLEVLPESVDDAAQVWAGPCLLSPVTSGDNIPTAPDLSEQVVRYEARLPYDAPLPARGAVLTLTAAQDPALVGIPLRILTVQVATFEVFRVLTVEPLR